MKFTPDSGARLRSAAIVLLTTLQLACRAGDIGRGLLVKWKDGPDSPAAAEGNARIGATVKRNFHALRWQLVELPSGLSVSDGLRSYSALEAVASVEPDRWVPVALPPAPNSDHVLADGPTSVRRASLAGPAPNDVTPNDPRFAQQWYLKKIGAPEAWATTTGSSNIVVAVLDMGVNYRHQDLQANMWRNPGESGLDANGQDKATNGIDDDGDGYVDDVHGIDVIDHDSDPIDGDSNYTHGTACASIIGASGNDGKGMTGMNWHVSIMAIRMLRSDSTAAQMLEAYDYLLGMRRRGVNLRVANMSYGYLSFAPESLRQAHQLLGEAGILQVCAAGNSGRNLDNWTGYPVCWRIPSMIIVGGTDTLDHLWSSSNYGSVTVDLAAPSVQMTVAWGVTPNGYTVVEGTSFAAPQVAGAAALLLPVQPNLTVDELKAALLGSVDQLAALKGKVATSGRLNIPRALAYLSNSNPAAIVVTASPRGQRTDPQAPIQMTFNRPMNRATVESALIISPPVIGTFEWAADSRSFSFRHDTPFDPTTRYSLRLLGIAEDQSGQGLDGNYNRAADGSPTDDFLWAFDFATGNDEFARAAVLAGTAGSVSGNNSRATYEGDSEYLGLALAQDWTAYEASLWYRWTPPDGVGWYTFDLTSGTSFDTELAIIAGDGLDRITLIAANDNYGARNTSRVSFQAQTGTTYSIVVAGKNDGIAPTQAGPFKLSWYPTPPPSFVGTQFSPPRAAPGAKLTLTGANFTGATAVQFNGAAATFANASTNNADLRITAIVPPDAKSGPITVVTPHGNVTSTLNFELIPPPISIARRADGELELRWSAIGEGVLLESSDDLLQAGWHATTVVPVIADGESRVTLNQVSAQFYRLRAPRSRLEFRPVGD